MPDEANAVDVLLDKRKKKKKKKKRKKRGITLASFNKCIYK